jgi:RNA polymerase sigma factor (sigma-70 family)
MQADPDLELVRALQAGDESALNELINRHAEKLYQFVYRHLLNEEEARDVAQETFTRAYFRIHRFQPSAKFSTWLYQITLNLCRDRHRSVAVRLRARTVPIDHVLREDFAGVSPALSPDEEVDCRAMLEALEHCLADLPEKLLTPLVLTTIDGLTQRDAALLLGISIKAVETRVYRARQKLVEGLKARRRKNGASSAVS